MNNEEFIKELIRKFMDLNLKDYPDFYKYKKILGKALWVLWIVKEALDIRMLTSERIAEIILQVMEESIEPRQITNSLNPAKGKVHIHKKDSGSYYEIMKKGKDYLKSQIKEGMINLLYFEPNKEFTGKRELSEKILQNLEGELRIVDPYCGIRTLDILSNISNDVVKFLTKRENLNKDKKRFLRELRDFNSEHPNFEFRDYTNRDIHDRYIISRDNLVLLGHSIKDLGGKESFAVILSKEENVDVYDAMITNFNRRWKSSSKL